MRQISIMLSAYNLIVRDFNSRSSQTPYMDKPDKNALLALIFITLIMLTTSTQVSEPYVSSCETDKTTFSPNSPFENNLKILLESLPTRTSLAGGFYNMSDGNGLDQVYGQALCRGDVNKKACRNCLEKAAQEMLKNCTAQEAIYWYALCQVHYSDSQITEVYTGKLPSSNDEEEKVLDTVHFPGILKNFMHNLSYRASYTELMYETGEYKVSEAEKIYGLVQCTRDVSQEVCRRCFDSAMLELDKCCSLRKGGTVFSRNCNVRFEMYRFYQYSPTRENAWKKWVVVAIIALASVLVLLISCCVFHLRRNKARHKAIVDEEECVEVLQNLENRNNFVMTIEDPHIVGPEELTFMEFSIIKAATDNFSDANKLGQGGFGTVYKGVLPDGKEIAVKRLSRKSWQGIEEFKNEIILMAKLQHRNLVRLLGCGVEGDEKLLLYEFMPNKGLDVIIFDSEERSRLDWDRRLNIIFGIARGLLYLHEDSRLKIIHRDLKPSNTLLDHEMAAKISDFGMARIFGDDQNTANTRRVVGTYGYMAPEYAMEGHFSVKSDIFSFGVILLEIISGKKNSGFYLTGQAQTLLAYAWQVWNDGEVLDFVDPWLRESCSTVEAKRCIHIGLLCVQEDPEDRPTMSSVMVLLGSETLELPQPMQPAFSVGRVVPQIGYSSSTNPSVNHLTVSSISPR